MSTVAMHGEAAGGSAGTKERPCDTCGTLFTPRKPWQRFCKTYGNKCHTAFHAAEDRLEKIRAEAPTLYQALASLGEVEGPVGEIARAAIKDLKAPETPKALLEKALA